MIPRGIIGGRLGYQLLRWIAGTRQPRPWCNGHAYAHRHKLEVLFGPSVWAECAGKTVIDYGCGEGRDAIELARRGARRVIGVDVRTAMLETANEHAAIAGVADRCSFLARPSSSDAADVMLSVDAFEHFEDPSAVLRHMRGLLRPDGVLLAAFGPPWLSPARRSCLLGISLGAPALHGTRAPSMAAALRAGRRDAIFARWTAG